MGFPGVDSSGLRDPTTVPFSSLKFKTVDGAAADTNIAIASIKTTAVILAAINLTDLADCSELPAVTSAGNIQFDTLATTGKKILVVYANV